ncbi:MAG: hypothetical protein Q9208_000654 [Pyrenodesmia sp. 3 TL-2023]
MAATSASTSTAKGRKKRTSQAVDDHDLDGDAEVVENGGAAGLSSKKAKISKDNGQAHEDRLFELPGTRRVTINTFKGNTLIHIREYYVDQNGEQRPGKKGISLTPTQYSAFMSLLPDVEAALVARGESIARPQYSDSRPPAEAEVERTPAELEDDGDADADEEKVEIKQERPKKSTKRENFEATSEEDE